MGGKHNKCCCDVSCTIVEDDFNRDTSDLGSRWTHPASAWKTVATPPWVNGYAESQANGAIAIHKTAHPVPDESGVVYVDIIDEVEDSGDKYRVIVNATDSDNYHYAEYTRYGNMDSILALGICSGGADTVLKSEAIEGLTDPLGEPRTLIVIIADNEFCAFLTHTVLSQVWVDESPTAGGYYAGLGGSEGTRFSHWTFSHHRHTKKECPACLCDCEENYLPPVLLANIVGTGRMGTLDCDLDLIWDRVQGAWYSPVVRCCDVDWELMFVCPEVPLYDRNSAKLSVLKGCKDTDYGSGPYYLGQGLRYSNDDSSCTPISLVFGPFQVAATDFACACPPGHPFPGPSGTYTITVTEAP